MRKFTGLLILTFLLSSRVSISASENATVSDSISSGFHSPMEWRIGAGVSPAWVIPTDPFYKGANMREEKIHASLSEEVTAAFSFSPDSKEGILYPGLYQGAGVGIRTFFNRALLGTPGSFYLFQGAPFKSWGSRLHLGYEWKFGIAFGWKHTGYENIDISSAISTPVTAHMGVALKLQYDLSDRWLLSLALEGTHFSNGNTSWRNGGLNSAGISAGVSYVINPLKSKSDVRHPSTEEDSLNLYRAEKERDIISALKEEADRKRCFFDIIAFGSWRQRTQWVEYADNIVDEEGNTGTETLCPDKYGVAGIVFNPLLRLNRWVAVGPGATLKWDGSAALTPYWIETSNPDILEVKYIKPSWGKQISLGLSAHAELTTPIFAINAAIGFNVINPKGEKRFYQSLTFKAFVSKNVFLNIGYCLGDFKTPNHLMLGLGWRI